MQQILNVKLISYLNTSLQHNYNVDQFCCFRQNPEYLVNCHNTLNRSGQTTLRLLHYPPVPEGTSRFS